MTVTSYVQLLAEAKCPKCRCDCTNLSDQAECQATYCTEQCPTCHGTGALVPGLRTRCAHPSTKFGMEYCIFCQGRGWVLLEVEKQIGVLVRVAKVFEISEDNGHWYIDNGWHSDADTPEEALAYAICQAMGPDD